MTTLNSSSRHHQRGAFSVIAAVMLLPLLAFMALVVDSGRLYMEKRVLQKAADTAALEAVARHGNCRPGSPRQAIPDPIHRLPRKRRWGPGPSPPSSWPESSSWAP